MTRTGEIWVTLDTQPCTAMQLCAHGITSTLAATYGYDNKETHAL